MVPRRPDAIRALTATIEDGNMSIALTDETLGIRQRFLPDLSSESGA